MIDPTTRNIASGYCCSRKKMNCKPPAAWQPAIGENLQSSLSCRLRARIIPPTPYSPIPPIPSVYQR